MKTFKTTKGIEIDASYRNGEGWEWKVNQLILGRIYPDGSFGKCIKLYIDENNIFQMKFLKGNDIVYTFLPECTELLNIMKDGMVGVNLGMLAEEMMQHGWTEVTGK